MARQTLHAVSDTLLSRLNHARGQIEPGIDGYCAAVSTLDSPAANRVGVEPADARIAGAQGVEANRHEPTSRESFIEGMIFGAAGAVIAIVVMAILALSTTA